MPVDNTSSSSLSSSISETSSILSSISSCCSHNVIDFDSGSVDNVSPGGNHRTSLQFILNQNQNNDTLDYWEFNNNNNEEEDLNQEYNNHDDNCYYYNYNSYYPNYHLNTSHHHHQFNTEYHHHQYQYNPSNGKLIPPPSPPPMEMDLLENNQILSSDEFNSIFDSFTAVVEGQNLNQNHNNLFIEDNGCMRGTNFNNGGLLDDEQLSKALGAIAMI